MSVGRTELVAEIAKRAALSETGADAALSAFRDILIESLKKGETVKVTSLINMERTSHTARTSRNPRTDEEIKISARFGAKISAGSTLKKAVTQWSASQH